MASRLVVGRGRKDKYVVIFLASVYVFCFVFLYANYGKSYAYLGIIYSENNSILLIFTSILILVYCAFSSFRVREISDFFVEAQFFIITVPALIVLSLQQDFSWRRFTAVTVLFSAHLLLKFVASRKIRKKIRPPSGKESAVAFYVFTLFTAASSIYLIIWYYPYMRIVGLSEVYEHRFYVRDAIQVPLGGYVIGYLQTAISPVLISVGIFLKKPAYLIVGLLIAFMIFSITAGKIALAQAFLTVLFGFFVKTRRDIRVSFLLMGLVGLLLLCTFLLIVADYKPDGLSRDILAVIYMRSFAIQGAMTGAYLDFFETNPLTFYSHVNIIDWVVEYPYQRPLGFVIGNYLGGQNNYNANASYWATDGFAALGLFGPFIIACIIGGFILLSKTFIHSSMIPVASTASIPFLMLMGNTSFFTNLITGGGLLLFLVIGLVVRTEDSASPNSSLKSPSNRVY